jgi:lipopolysaccharide export system permease protein
MVLSRWWKDSEMVIWLSSGKSLVDLIAPVWKFLWPMILLVAFFSVVAGPWARYQMSAFEDTIEKRGDAQRVSPGQFRESYSGQRVFFLENPDDEGGKLGAIFIRSMEPNGNRVIVASKTGRMESDDKGQSWVVLQQGYRSDMTPGSLESRTTAFDVYRIRLDQSSPAFKPQDAVRTTPTWELWSRSEPAAKGEMLFRFGIPLLTIALGIIAIPLAVSNARSGRAVNLIVALLIYLMVSNLFGSMKVAASQGRLDLGLAWWPVPLAVLLAAALMFYWRMAQLPSVIDVMWLLYRRVFRRAGIKGA